jgi:hypothetical protein
MKKYSNIPLKERKRNADKMFRHEVRLEEINEKRLIEEKHREMEEMIREKYRQENAGKTDKERQEEEAFAKLREFLKWKEESEDTE